MLKIRSNIELPEGIETPEQFIYRSLNDLFFFCVFVMGHGKKREYKDLNHLHMQFCDWLDFKKNPILQKLALMSRDTLKSTIGRAFITQQFLDMSYHNEEKLLGIVTGDVDLSAEHLKIINNEIIRNELIQTYFHGHVPSKESDADVWTKEKVRYKKIGIDIGSLKKSLTGRHYGGIWNDNFMNEVNSATPDYRRYCVNRWQQQESLLAENAWELITETPWEKDDVSGIILDPDGKFDYKSIHRKSPAIFISKTGYSVFACGAVNKAGKPNFPEKGMDEKYLERKKRKQGQYTYMRMYELLPLSEEEKIFRRKWIIHYQSLPDNFIRNIAVDCAGTKKKESSHSAVSVGEWDGFGDLTIPYAKKKKVTPLELFRWVCEVWDQSVKDERWPTFLLIEREKYGIFLADLIESERPDIFVMTVALKGRPRNARMLSLVPLYEHGKIKSRQGLIEYEEEVDEYRLDKSEGVDILDTIFLHTEGKLVPQKVGKFPEVDDEDDDFGKQLKAERYGKNKGLEHVAANF